MKKFKAESQKVLDLMINSIYTHKEIFMRELLSNASDAIDKLYYKSLTENLSFSKSDFSIRIEADKENRTLKIIDNGIGMDENELDNNLGVIAKSGSQEFKATSGENQDISIIGQFGVGFYSAFMVAKKVEVLSKKYGSEDAYLWSSDGSEGYSIKKAEKESHGTEITLWIKESTEEENYAEFLEGYKISALVKKYSDYIKYPIIMKKDETMYEEDDEDDKETEVTLNSMIPLWKKKKGEVTDEEYVAFYQAAFGDYEKPLRTIHTSVEGAVSYTALMFIPSKAPYNYYSKEYEKGLKLYTNGVLITDKCSELIPDYFSFVKGLADTELALNLSRETIQHNHQLKKIAKSIEKKIHSELTSLLENDREAYEKFFKQFGLQLKYGLYANWGVNKDTLQDLVLFHSIKKDKPVTFKEYRADMPESQKYIYYATGSSPEAIKLLPQTERVLDMGYDILCMVHDVDEFALRFMMNYDGKEFKSVSSADLGLTEIADTETETDKELLSEMKKLLGDKVDKVRVSSHLKNHPVCFVSEGDVSIEMEKVLSAMPVSQGIKARKVLEINGSHSVYSRLKEYFANDKDKFEKLTKVLYSQALIIEGLPLESPAEYSALVCGLIAD